jgi:hypothetical protein
VKHIYPAIIQLIIQYFKRISSTIKTDKQTFFLIALYRKIVSGGAECPMNIGLGNFVPKSRLFTYYIGFHLSDFPLFEILSFFEAELQACQSL